MLPQLSLHKPVRGRPRKNDIKLRPHDHLTHYADESSSNEKNSIRPFPEMIPFLFYQTIMTNAFHRIKLDINHTSISSSLKIRTKNGNNDENHWPPTKALTLTKLTKNQKQTKTRIENTDTIEEYIPLTTSTEFDKSIFQTIPIDVLDKIEAGMTKRLIGYAIPFFPALQTDNTRPILVDADDEANTTSSSSSSMSIHSASTFSNQHHHAQSPIVVENNPYYQYRIHLWNQCKQFITHFSLFNAARHQNEYLFRLCLQYTPILSFDWSVSNEFRHDKYLIHFSTILAPRQLYFLLHPIPASSITLYNTNSKVLPLSTSLKSTSTTSTTSTTPTKAPVHLINSIYPPPETTFTTIHNSTQLILPDNILSASYDSKITLNNFSFRSLPHIHPYLSTLYTSAFAIPTHISLQDVDVTALFPTGAINFAPFEKTDIIHDIDTIVPCQNGQNGQNDQNDQNGQNGQNISSDINLSSTTHKNKQVGSFIHGIADTAALCQGQSQVQGPINSIFSTMIDSSIISSIKSNNSHLFFPPTINTSRFIPVSKPTTHLFQQSNSLSSSFLPQSQSIFSTEPHLFHSSNQLVNNNNYNTNISTNHSISTLPLTLLNQPNKITIKRTRAKFSSSDQSTNSFAFQPPTTAITPFQPFMASSIYTTSPTCNDSLISHVVKRQKISTISSPIPLLSNTKTTSTNQPLQIFQNQNQNDQHFVHIFDSAQQPSIIGDSNRSKSIDFSAISSFCAFSTDQCKIIDDLLNINLKYPRDDTYLYPTPRKIIIDFYKLDKTKSGAIKGQKISQNDKISKNAKKKKGVKKNTKEYPNDADQTNSNIENQLFDEKTHSDAKQDNSQISLKVKKSKQNKDLKTKQKITNQNKFEDDDLDLFSSSEGESSSESDNDQNNSTSELTASEDENDKPANTTKKSKKSKKASGKLPKKPKMSTKGLDFIEKFQIELDNDIDSASSETETELNSKPFNEDENNDGALLCTDDGTLNIPKYLPNNAEFGQNDEKISFFDLMNLLDDFDSSHTDTALDMTPSNNNINPITATSTTTTYSMNNDTGSESDIELEFEDDDDDDNNISTFEDIDQAHALVVINSQNTQHSQDNTHQIVFESNNGHVTDNDYGNGNKSTQIDTNFNIASSRNDRPSSFQSFQSHQTDFHVSTPSTDPNFAPTISYFVHEQFNYTRYNSQNYTFSSPEEFTRITKQKYRPLPPYAPVSAVIKRPNAKNTGLSGILTTKTFTHYREYIEVSILAKLHTKAVSIKQTILEKLAPHRETLDETLMLMLNAKPEVKSAVETLSLSSVDDIDDNVQSVVIPVSKLAEITQSSSASSSPFSSAVSSASFDLLLEKNNDSSNCGDANFLKFCEIMGLNDLEDDIFDEIFDLDDILYNEISATSRNQQITQLDQHNNIDGNITSIELPQGVLNQLNSKGLTHFHTINDFLQLLISPQFVQQLFYRYYIDQNALLFISPYTPLYDTSFLHTSSKMKKKKQIKTTHIISLNSFSYLDNLFIENYFKLHRQNLTDVMELPKLFTWEEKISYHCTWDDLDCPILHEDDDCHDLFSLGIVSDIFSKAEEICITTDNAVDILVDGFVSDLHLINNHNNNGNDHNHGNNNDNHNDNYHGNNNDNHNHSNHISYPPNKLNTHEGVNLTKIIQFDTEADKKNLSLNKQLDEIGLGIKFVQKNAEMFVHLISLQQSAQSNISFHNPQQIEHHIIPRVENYNVSIQSENVPPAKNFPLITHDNTAFSNAMVEIPTRTSLIEYTPSTLTQLIPIEQFHTTFSSIHQESQSKYQKQKDSAKYMLTKSSLPSRSPLLFPSQRVVPTGLVTSLQNTQYETHPHQIGPSFFYPAGTAALGQTTKYIRLSHADHSTPLMYRSNGQFLGQLLQRQGQIIRTHNENLLSKFRQEQFDKDENTILIKRRAGARYDPMISTLTASDGNTCLENENYDNNNILFPHFTGTSTPIADTFTAIDNTTSSKLPYSLTYILHLLYQYYLYTQWSTFFLHVPTTSTTAIPSTALTLTSQFTSFHPSLDTQTILSRDSIPLSQKSYSTSPVNHIFHHTSAFHSHNPANDTFATALPPRQSTYVICLGLAQTSQFLLWLNNAINTYMLYLTQSVLLKYHFSTAIPLTSSNIAPKSTILETKQTLPKLNTDQITLFSLLSALMPPLSAFPTKPPSFNSSTQPIPIPLHCLPSISSSTTFPVLSSYAHLVEQVPSQAQCGFILAFGSIKSKRAINIKQHVEFAIDASSVTTSNNQQLDHDGNPLSLQPPLQQQRHVGFTKLYEYMLFDVFLRIGWQDLFFHSLECEFRF